MFPCVSCSSRAEKYIVFSEKKRLTSCPNRLYGEKGKQTKCGAFISRTKSQVRQIVCLAIRGKTQKGVIRQLIITNGTLRLKLTKINKRAKALFYYIIVIYDTICNISEILYIIYYLKKSKSNVKIYNILYFSQNK